MKHNNIQIMGIPEEESKQRIENLLEEIMTEHSATLVKGKDIQVQEAQRVPKNLDPKRPALGPIVIKMTRLKDNPKCCKRKAGSYLQGSTN